MKFYKSLKSSIFIYLLFIIGFLLAISSCKETDVEPNGIRDVIIDLQEYRNAPNDPLVINSLKIEGDNLIIDFSASGCDGKTWVVKLIDSGMIAESYPVQRTLRLSLENKEACDAFIGKEISFNIKSLQIQGYDRVSLNVSGKNILYVY